MQTCFSVATPPLTLLVPSQTLPQPSSPTPPTTTTTTTTSSTSTSTTPLPWITTKANRLRSTHSTSRATVVLPAVPMATAVDIIPTIIRTPRINSTMISNRDSCPQHSNNIHQTHLITPSSTLFTLRNIATATMVLMLICKRRSLINSTFTNLHPKLRIMN
ncbi:hypothetical protein EDD21DRAFT_392770 [Dissophora ornata]|nr:hypothetical protein EDD21DRAFT_392770 [Dissophora ornata]